MGTVAISEEDKFLEPVPCESSFEKRASLIREVMATNKPTVIQENNKLMSIDPAKEAFVSASPKCGKC